MPDPTDRDSIERELAAELQQLKTEVASLRIQLAICATAARIDLATIATLKARIAQLEQPSLN